MNEDEKRELLPEKYHPLINSAFSVTYDSKTNELCFFFIDYEPYRQFLVLYEHEDFSEYKLIILFSGDCQNCGQYEHGDSHDFLLINSLRAKIAEALKAKMLVHLCDPCREKVAGGIRKMIVDLFLDLGKIKDDPSIPQEKKEELILAIGDLLMQYPVEMQDFISRLDKATSKS